MSTLHTLSTNPHSLHPIQSFIDLMGETDELLLLANGVYGALVDAEISIPLGRLREPGRLYVLKDDLLARGIPASASLQASLISYEGFVDLVVKHQNTYNWA